jgi:hypothetical protein
MMGQQWRLLMLLLVWQQPASHWTLGMQVRWVVREPAMCSWLSMC